MATWAAPASRPPTAANIRRAYQRQPPPAFPSQRVGESSGGVPGGFGPASGGFDDALGVLVGFAVAARLEGLWPHFKLCARKECGRAFFDASVNYTGTWCTAAPSNASHERYPLEDRSAAHLLVGLALLLFGLRVAAGVVSVG